MISEKAKQIVANIRRISDEDLNYLTDSLYYERSRRNPVKKKSHLAGYFPAYQRHQREVRMGRNGPNNLLRDYRRVNKLTQAEMGRRLGKSTSVICQYETGAIKTPEWVNEKIERWNADGFM